jgi:sugar/nucleoside kinase (ribokinase family)
MAAMRLRSGVIAGGNWIVDHVKLIDQWPPQDSLALVLGHVPANGGAPYNVLKNLARLGAPFPLEAIGLLGADVDGHWIRADCAAHGIETTQLHSTGAASTSNTDVMTVVSSGRRTFFHQPGTNALLAPEHFDFSRTSAKLFHLGYLLLLGQLDALDGHGRPRAAEVLQRARGAGLRTSLDCVSENSDRFRRVVAPALREVDLLFANDFEAERLTGEVLTRNGLPDCTAIERATISLLAQGVRDWVVIHLPEAAYARSVRGESLWQPSVCVPSGEIRGAAGAGDALAAGVLWGCHEEWPMTRALELGVCVAAASLFHPTCSEGVRPLPDCLALGQRYGFRSLP